MARIAGVNIPENKHVEISLTHIFGIGRKTAQNICERLKIDYTRKISDLSEEEIESIRNSVAEYVVERLWRDAKLMEIGGGTIESHQKNNTRDLAKDPDAVNR